MESLSVIIMSKDDHQKVIGLIRHIYNLCSEIVILDSSNSKNRKILDKECKDFKKVKIQYVIPVGYADPFFMYGISKCTNKWVLLLGSDERLSKSFRDNIHNFINTKEYDAFAFKRHEEAGATAGSGLETWQIRLFKKGKATFKGIIHEQPTISGKTLRVEDKNVYIDHVYHLRGTAGLMYGKMERFERLSYKLFNQKFMEFLYKLEMPKEEIGTTIHGHLLYSLLRFYEIIKLKDLDEEISNFDYYILYTLRDLAYSIKRRKLRDAIQVFGNERKRIAVINGWKKSPLSSEEFGISIIIHDIGITRFLNLDRENTVSMLNHKYGDKSGVDLLIKLLRDKYKKSKRTFKQSE